ITRGVSEDYLYAESKQVGVVVDNFTEKEIKKVWSEIKRYLDMSPDDRRKHCREVGLAYRGSDSLKPVFKAAVNYLVNSSSV
ncbi:MAG: hypothetical protein D3908_15825, partial [Candidatus Electrothrix sp. AUS4]|nr:hypothetical protein [Candidatus Electrothrix sp. AUS4]